MTKENNFTENESEPNQHLRAEQIVVISIGELFRKKREERGLNLKIISQHTKIHIGLLEHLENNQLDKLPSKTYVRGFVKSTAKILGIDQEEALHSLELTYNGDHKNKISKENTDHQILEKVVNHIQTPVPTPTPAAAPAFPFDTVKNITNSSTYIFVQVAKGLLILGVIVFVIKNLIDRSTEEHLKLPHVLSTIRPRDKSNRLIQTKALTKAIENNAENNLEITDEPTPMKVNIIQDKKENDQQSEMTINDIKLKTISLGEKQFTFDNSIKDDELDEIFPSRYKVLVTKGIESLFINATDGNSWITYKIDEKEIKKYVLRQGRTLFLRGEKIRLFIGNTKSLKVFYNNKLISFGAKTAGKNLVLPDELKTKYMAPLFVFQKDGTALTSDEYVKSNEPATLTTPMLKPVVNPKIIEISPVLKQKI